MEFENYLNEPIQKDSEQLRRSRVNRTNKQFAKTRTTKAEKTPRDKSPIFQPVDGIPEVRKIGAAMSGNAKDALRNFVTRTPYYKTIEEQLNLIKAEIVVYKSIGDKENYQKSAELIKQLSTQKHDISKRFTNEYASIKSKGTETKPRLRDAPEIKEIQARLDSLNERFADNNPGSICNKLNYVRNAMKIDGRKDAVAVDDMDFDSFASSEEKLESTNSVIEHEKLCTKIAMALDMDVQEVKNTATSALKKMLTEVADVELLEQLKADIAEAKTEISIVSAKLGGHEDITNIMFNTFDYETVSEEIPKNVLAAANVEYVKSIAYNMCKNNGTLQYLEDAEAYGLLGLSIALDKWYKTQRLKTEVPLSFRAGAYMDIVYTMKKGLWAMSSTTTNPDAASNLDHKRKKEISDFMHNNPELKDMPYDMVEMIINSTEGITASIAKTSNETDIVSRFGEDVDEGDVWSSITRDNTDEAGDQVGYDALLHSIKSLFSLFEQAPNKAAKSDQFKKKLFNKFDFKLFKMWMGIERNTTDPLKTKNYSYEEMGKILSDYYAQNGDLNHTFSAPAIKDRLDKMAKKIKKVFELYPSIREGFEYLLNVSHMETTVELAEDMSKISIKQQYVQSIPLKEQQYVYRQGALD